jgi:hypothetical protein
MPVSILGEINPIVVGIWILALVILRRIEKNEKTAVLAAGTACRQNCL